jgi:prepilin-type N-terminal cleavage/methylation domain-containing protein
MQRIRGFTMIELLVVLIILAILVAVAAPMYFGNTRRAKASEAVAVMGTIRQVERDFRISNGNYFDVAVNGTTGNIQKVLPTSVAAATGVPSPADSGVGIDLGVSQYFSNGAFSVNAVNHGAGQFTNPTAVDFIISATGAAAQNNQCVAGSTTNCAVHATDADAAAMQLQMDNSGRVMVSYDSGTTWAAY